MEQLKQRDKHTTRQNYEGVYTSLIPQVNYTEGPAHNSLPSSVRTLLQAPNRSSPKRPVLDHTEPLPCLTTTGPRSPNEARTEAPKPRDYTALTHPSSDPPSYNGAPHTRKRPPEDNPQRQPPRDAPTLTTHRVAVDSLVRIYLLTRIDHKFAYGNKQT
jgi:hypothetical protein